MKKKIFALTAMLMTGASLFQVGCLNSFWKGFFNEGWPSNNRWLNIAVDILNEELFG